MMASNNVEQKRFTCTIDGCGRTFANQQAKNDHRRDKHGKKTRQGDPYNRKRPMAAMDRDDVYAFVDALDLPDGAHWAMIEELSGLEPGDFA
ncbi:hypothetical protein [Sphingobium fuliginis]|uniref:hypothetical protein n=1 Tax=Sphingobium fuliginis (strain ATCC 27551) TaxID=336203 RepID=UPI0037C69C8D